MSHHGINLSLGALRSAHGSGVGEYLDLLELLPWCRDNGFNIIQLLPLNDSGSDPSPYSALSAYALHPLYISLKELPGGDSLQTSNGQRVDYHGTRAAKEGFLRQYATQALPTIRDQEDYQQFLIANPWLLTYARFKALKSLYGGIAWWDWPASNVAIADEELEYHYLVQYLAHRQLQQVHQEANRHGILLKGDIPILINRDSADVWANQPLFNLQLAAGAPPDMYSSEGQNWGFPLYNWPAHAQSGYSWWRGRLQTAETCYDLYRLDHIVGFYRIWACPVDGSARDGSFVPKDEATWIPHGERILRVLLDASRMRPIGEDLGTIPPAVRLSMHRLGIPGTKVMRWERDWDGDRHFIPIANYPTDSMTTISTHDSPTFTQWWDADDEEVGSFCNDFDLTYQTPMPFQTRHKALQLAHATASSYHINLLQEYLALFPELVWPDPADERINQPGRILDTNWTYRFRPTIAEITSHQGLQEALRAIVPRG